MDHLQDAKDSLGRPNTLTRSLSDTVGNKPFHIATTVLGMLFIPPSTKL